MARRCIAFVHAHPDDESLGTGGTIARYAAEGAHVCLITCTNGELGEIADVPEVGVISQDDLGAVRVRELEAAVRALSPDGRIDLRMLGFHDSGMDGTPENASPIAFVNQPLEVVVGRVVEIFREVEPQVVVTYNEVGFYGHPDHIRAHQAAVAAADVVGVPKVYYTAMPKSLMRMAVELAPAMGAAAEEFFSEDDVEQLGTDDERISAAIDCTRWIDHKFRALEAHRTQLGTTHVFLHVPDEFRSAMGTEYYVLGRSSVPRKGGVETDLFEGLP